jgi:hypothetical protein
MTAAALVLLGILGVPVGMSTAEALHAIQTATLLQSRERLGLDAFVTGTPRCPATAKHCVGIVVHVVVADDEPVQTPAHFAAHVADANRLFEPIGIGFEVDRVEAEPAAHVDMEDREDRDGLGVEDFSRGVVHVYLVRKLADVDVAGEVIRGVHWRFRPDTSRRWIILSSIASSLVLAHEMGHFFGLPHSSYSESIMNKKPAPGRPAWPFRVFAEPEIRRMARHRDRMFADGSLVDRAKDGAANRSGR